MNRGLIVSGASGAGKSSVAGEISGAWRAAVRRAPSSMSTRSHSSGRHPQSVGKGRRSTACSSAKSVGSLWLNLRDAGALHLVVAAQIRSVHLRGQYQKALEDCALQVVLLTAPPDLLRQRLVARPPDPFHSKTYGKDGAVRQEVLEGAASEQGRLQAAEVPRLCRHQRWLTSSDRGKDPRAGWLDAVSSRGCRRRR